ncbi:MAG: GTP cyclohydrolase I, partial [Anaerolineales bacterium]|nr:GTP cyclohydrolase I [Anaerolineales bacterium]
MFSNNSLQLSELYQVNHSSNGHRAPVDQKSQIREAVSQILANIGEDPDREGLLSTPDRVARMYDELTAGH